MIANRKSILLNPFYISALAVLVINDQILKVCYPGWITGKLSDFAGLVVFSGLLCVFCRRKIAVQADVLVVHLFAGIAFAAWKILPISSWLVALALTGSVPLPSVTHDPTDLVALLILPVSYRLVSSMPRAGFSRAWRGLAVFRICVLVVSCAAVIATSPPWYRYQSSETVTVSSKMSKARLLYTIESTLVHEGFVVYERNVLGDDYFSIEFNNEESYRLAKKAGDRGTTPRIYSAELRVQAVAEEYQIEIVDILMGRKTGRVDGDRYIEDKLVKPLRRVLETAP